MKKYAILGLAILALVTPTHAAKLSGGHLINSVTSTATASGTTTLTNASSDVQRFTGTLTQSVVLPDATTLKVGTEFKIINDATGSSGVVTVTANGGSPTWSMYPGERFTFTVRAVNTAAGSWIRQSLREASLFETLTDKGDLISASAPGAPATLAASTDGFILSLDSAQTTGLKWISPSGVTTNSFDTVVAPSGNSAVATTSSDDLTFTTSDSTMIVEGTAATDTINFRVGTLPLSGLLKNIGILTSVSGNALTIALKQTDASTNCAAATPCQIAIPNVTAAAASGSYNIRSVTGALSVVVSSGSTLGATSGAAHYYYVYAIDNAGTVELAISMQRFPENTVITTTAEGGAGAADSNALMYSTTARSNVNFRLLGRIKATEATAGTWATAPVEVVTTPNMSDVKIIAHAITSSTSITNGSQIEVVFGTKVIDTHNAYSTSTGRFTCPVTGYYRVNVYNMFDTASFTGGNTLITFINNNGSTVTQIGSHRMMATLSTYATVSGSGIVACTAGNYISEKLSHDEATPRALYSGAGFNGIFIEKIADQ